MSALLSVKDSNREAIEQYLINGGEGVLTEKQQEILKRWEFADEMIRRQTGILNRIEVCNLIKARFGISQRTAYTDMLNAEEVFSSSNPLNKKHRIQIRIEFLEKQVKKAAELKDWKGVAAIEKNIASYIKIYPDLVNSRPQRQVVFNIQYNALQSETLSPEQTEDVLNNALKLLPDDGD